MQLLTNPGSILIRHNPQMKSLWIEYPRQENEEDIHAVLFDNHSTGQKFRLPVLKASSKGIKIKLPSFISGMFYLKIEDGTNSFLRHIALQ
jgi:hypothetical protein